MQVFIYHENKQIILTITEDIDPSVGRFRNMIQTAVIPIKVSFGFGIYMDELVSDDLVHYISVVLLGYSVENIIIYIKLHMYDFRS